MSVGAGRWSLSDHTGDIAILVEGPDETTLFEVAAEALFGVIVELGNVESRETVPIHVEGAADLEDLLVRFLSELLFLHDARGWLFRGARVLAIGPEALEAEAVGEPFDPARHAVARQVKAVTYHGLSISRSPDGLRARVVLDL